MQQVFISYSRAQTGVVAAFLRNRIALEFGRGSVFRDVETLRGSEKYENIINNSIKSCDVFIVLLDISFFNRGYQKMDWMTRELKYAFEADKIVYPIFVTETNIPSTDELCALPDPWSRLSSINCRKLSGIDVDSDMKKIMDDLDELISKDITLTVVSLKNREKRAMHVVIGVVVSACIFMFASTMDYLKNLTAMEYEEIGVLTGHHARLLGHRTHCKNSEVIIFNCNPIGIDKSSVSVCGSTHPETGEMRFRFEVGVPRTDATHPVVQKLSMYIDRSSGVIDKIKVPEYKFADVENVTNIFEVVRSGDGWIIYVFKSGVKYASINIYNEFVNDAPGVRRAPMFRWIGGSGGEEGESGRAAFECEKPWVDDTDIIVSTLERKLK
jgi:hypothetical protein